MVRSSRLVALSCLALVAAPLGLAHCGGSDDTPEGTTRADGGKPVSAEGGGIDAGVDAPSDASDAAVVCTDHTQKLVIDSIVLPQSRTDFAIDLNGDTKTDNQLGNIIGVLGSQNIDSQAAMNDAVATGKALHLLDETSTDATYQTDPSCARAGIQLATDKASPVFDGTGTFTADGTAQRGAFSGAIATGAFDATQPSTMTTPVELHVKIAIGASLVRLPVTGAHVSFTFLDGKVSGGKLQGAVRQTDITNTVVPAIAKQLDDAVQADPSSQQSKETLAIFDTGGCQAGAKNFDGSAAASGDKKIATCEVAENAVIKNVMNSDVQMFDGTTYKPSAANSVKDSLSIGFGFTAVPATL